MVAAKYPNKGPSALYLHVIRSKLQAPSSKPLAVCLKPQRLKPEAWGGRV